MVETKLPGPVQEYIFPTGNPEFEAVKFKGKPVQTGVLLPKSGMGKAFITTEVEAEAVHPFTSVTVTI